MAISFKNPHILLGSIGTALPIYNKAVTLINLGWIQATNLSGNRKALGWCIQEEGSTCWVLTKGIVTLVGHGWSIGDTLYLTTGGDLTNSLITTNIQQKIGYVLDSNTFWFEADQFIFQW